MQRFGQFPPCFFLHIYPLFLIFKLVGVNPFGSLKSRFVHCNHNTPLSSFVRVTSFYVFRALPLGSWSKRSSLQLPPRLPTSLVHSPTQIALSHLQQRPAPAPLLAQLPQTAELTSTIFYWKMGHCGHIRPSQRQRASTRTRQPATAAPSPRSHLLLHPGASTVCARPPAAPPACAQRAALCGFRAALPGGSPPACPARAPAPAPAPAAPAGCA